MYKKACADAKMETACKAAGGLAGMRGFAASQPQPRGAGAVLAGFFDLTAAWSDRRRQRLALSALDDNMLRDIGLSRADVEREFKKPFWMV